MGWARTCIIAMNRLRRSFLTRVLVLLCVATLLWLQVTLLIYHGSGTDYRQRASNFSVHVDNVTSAFAKLSTGLARPTNLTATELQQIFKQENEAQVILNSHNLTWPPPLQLPLNSSTVWPHGVVLVIQVHNRISYLKKLIDSFSRVHSIERALLVFSHDFYSEDLNDLIRSIKFCAVLQIFFPYAIQLYPSTFPGDSPLDCPRDTKKEKALAVGCANADWPDVYGHYREARFSQTKHHWWWKANFIFAQVRVMEAYNGPVVFLEEDHYVAEDALHVLWLQQQLLSGSPGCPACSSARILSLGSYPKAFNFKSEGSKVDLVPWSSSKHNMGMAFNRTTWNEFLGCAEMFCTVDDYNWDWSLLHVAQKCLPSRSQNPKDFVLSALVLKVPRVFHIGECGVHHRKRTCGAESSVTLRKAELALTNARKNGYLYPANLTVKNLLATKVLKLKKANGGWGDLRDKQLCLAMTRT